VYSVFFKMSEIISNVLFGIAERIFLKEKERFREEYRFTIKPSHGWIFTQTADKYFAEYRGNRILFRPRFAILKESEHLKNLPVTSEMREPERVYISWREVASEEFFKDVEELFKALERGKGRKTGKRKVAPTTKGG